MFTIDLSAHGILSRTPARVVAVTYVLIPPASG
jgi:hypothetical protein